MKARNVRLRAFSLEEVKMTISSTKVVGKSEKEVPVDDKNSNLNSQILGKLGVPNNLHKIDCKNVGEFNFRANVYCDIGEIYTSLRIIHSFFITVDSNGLITKSNPSIERVYE
jgi:hypothetical protein